MIRHIVLWKLQAEDATERANAVEAVASALEPLIHLIPGIASLAVRANVAYADVNWDIALIGDYESVEALDAYQVHPDHVAAVQVVRANVSERASIDVEL